MESISKYHSPQSEKTKVNVAIRNKQKNKEQFRHMPYPQPLCIPSLPTLAVCALTDTPTFLFVFSKISFFVLFNKQSYIINILSTCRLSLSLSSTTIQFKIFTQGQTHTHILTRTSSNFISSISNFRPKCRTSVVGKYPHELFFLSQFSPLFPLPFVSVCHIIYEFLK